MHSERIQIFCSFFIILESIYMTFSIYLNYQLQTRRIEINNIASDWLLTMKFIPEFSSSQEKPHIFLHVICNFSIFFCIFEESGIIFCVTPSNSPFSGGESTPFSLIVNIQTFSYILDFYIPEILLEIRIADRNPSK